VSRRASHLFVESLNLFVQSRYGFFQHATVWGEHGTAEVLLCSSSRQFQRAPLLFRKSGLRGHSWSERRPPESFFLLGFDKLGIKSSRHV
jgi:hypothetical protein